MQTKTKLGLLTVVLIIYCSTISASSAGNYAINDKSYSNYFNTSGYLNNTNIVSGDVLDCSGRIKNKNMYINIPLNITSTDKTGMIINSTIIILTNGSGTNITNLKINNTDDNCHGIYLFNTENNIIKNNTIQSDGIRGHCIVLVGSKYNHIIGNNLSEYGTVNGWTHSPIILGDSHYNIIANNYIVSNVSNCIYLCMYSFADYTNGNLCTYNDMIDNTCLGVDTSWCYAIQIMGAYNKVINNTIRGSYRGISSEQDNGGNIIIGNNIAATYCGIWVSSNCTVTGNIITGYNTTHNGIIAIGSNAKILDNFIKLFRGNGIYLAGSDCTVSGNNIATANYEAVYIYGMVHNISISENIISSNIMGIVLKQQSSSKLPTNITISNNNITCKENYAVDSSEGSKSVITGNYLVSSGKQGNNALVLASSDIVLGNYGNFIAYADVPSGSFKKALTVHLTASDHQDLNPKIYYTLNGSAPTKNSLLYNGSIHIKLEKTTILKFIGVNKYGNVSGVVTKVYTLDKVAPTVFASVKSGKYKVNKVVSLKMNEAGTIYYTLNGGTPVVRSLRYVKPLVFSSSKTLKFFAIDNAGNKSPIYTLRYVIDKIVPKVVSTTPRNGGNGVSRPGSIILRFSEHINFGVNWSKVYLKNVKTGKLVAIKQLIKGNNLIINTRLKQNLNTSYTVYIPSSAVKDDAGNFMTKGYIKNFKTGKN
ncbi:MAG: chitobiase/beta-hexosaminidase C-terminal domain-containing protein [Methanobacterium sp. ERen5]|nr:MAG: chitobiase/beta-hexosaminidase C-terminal domain-containing protein [Methanobacterium sp. ERen5]